MNRLLALTLTIFLTATGAPVPSTAEPVTDQWLGTWIGELPYEPEPIVLELTLTHFDGQNLGYGMLCHVWQHLGITYVWDLGPGRHTAGTPEFSRRKRLSIDFPFQDTKYTFYQIDSRTLRLRLKRRKQLDKLRLERADSNDAPCASRVQLLPPPQSGN